MLCNEFQKVCVNADSCQSYIELPLESEVDGEALMIWEFNGRKHQTNVTLASGVNIQIPNLLNENYLHKVFIKNGENIIGGKVFLVDVKVCVKHGQL